MVGVVPLGVIAVMDAMTLLGSGKGIGQTVACPKALFAVAYSEQIAAGVLLFADTVVPVALVVCTEGFDANKATEPDAVTVVVEMLSIKRPFICIYCVTKGTCGVMVVLITTGATTAVLVMGELVPGEDTVDETVDVVPL